MSDKDAIDRELESGRTNAEVDGELSTLKAEMGKPTESDGETDGEATSEDLDEELDAMDVSDENVETELEELKNDDES